MPPFIAQPLDSDAVCRTAVDALQAKYSAVLFAGYRAPKPKRHGVSRPTEDDKDELVAVATSPSLTPTPSTYRYDQLLQCMTKYFLPSPKRQIPLINAGYGIRIATVLHQIETYVAFHRWKNYSMCKKNINQSISRENQHQSPPPEIQIVVMGCGLDVTGLWSLSLVDPDEFNPPTSSSIGIHVIEIDVPVVCTSKIQAIQSLSLLDHFCAGSGNGRIPGNNNNKVTTACSTATMNVWHGVGTRNTKARYTILSADLRDQSLIEEIFTSIGVIDTNLPTLLVSELVLTYLPPHSCDHILQRFSTLFRQSGSGTLLYEPLGPTTMAEHIGDYSNDSVSKNVSVLPILESYQALYCNSFHTKLQRGLATTHRNVPLNSGGTPQLRFHPLGASAAKIRERLQQLGYDPVDVATAGTVASHLQRNSATSDDDHEWKAMELFDEHAALTLHLHSYVVVTAFPNVVSSIDAPPNVVDNDMFRQYLCPWLCKTGLQFRPQPIGRLRTDNDTSLTTNSCIWMTTLRKQDERQVRDLFHQTYRHLFDDYPSIRKMVKSALRKDLGAGGSSSSSSDESCSVVVGTNDDSVIGVGYQKQGGDFMIAVRTNSSPKKILEAEIMTSVESTNICHVRQVVGGIGIRQCTTEECASRSIPSNDTICYEIHRFFVDDDCRGYGIGTALLQQMTSALIQRRKRQLPRRLQPNNHNSDTRMPSSGIPLLYLTATTPTILTDANQFYRTHGFLRHSTAEIGELTMTTYIKAVHA